MWWLTGRETPSYLLTYLLSSSSSSSSWFDVDVDFLWMCLREWLVWLNVNVDCRWVFVCLECITTSMLMTLNYLTLPYLKTPTLFWKTTSDCYLDVKNWMTQNKLQLNREKTEAILIGTRQKLSSISVNTLQLNNNTVPLTLSKASEFPSTAHCPWRTSSVKPPKFKVKPPNPL